MDFKNHLLLPKRWYRGLGILLGTVSTFVSMATCARAAEDDLVSGLYLTSDYLKIEWISEGNFSEEAATGVKDQIVLACQALGEAMLRRHGAWGLGIFSSYGCFEHDVLIAGSVGKASWVMTVSDSPKRLRLRMQMLMKPKPRQSNDLEKKTRERSSNRPEPEVALAEEVPVGQIDLPGSEFQRELFLDEAYVAIVVALVYDNLPMALATSVNAHSVPVPAAVSAVSPKEKTPDRLQLFLLSFDLELGVWQVKSVGEAVAGTALGEGGSTQVWQLNFDPTLNSKRLKRATVFAQRPSRPGRATGGLIKAMRARRKEVLTDTTADGFEKIRNGIEAAIRFAMLDNIASGYAGFRVGESLVDPKTALFPRSQLIGLVGEGRSGITRGLRIYIDDVPRVNRNIDDVTLHYGFTRVLLGFGLGIEPHSFVDRIEIAPKLGAWSVDARLPRRQEDRSVVVEDFKISRALSGGLEGSAEWEARQYLFRIWYARDLSAGAVLLGSGSSVVSSRYGIDWFLRGPSLDFLGKGWHLSYLLFALDDSVTLTGKKVNPAPDEAPTYSIGSDTSFAGGGLSLSW